MDELGRIVLPIELRKTLKIGERDGLEMFVDDNKIILTKYIQPCVFCGKTENLVTFQEKLICKDCIDSLIHR